MAIFYNGVANQQAMVFFQHCTKVGGTKVVQNRGFRPVEGHKKSRRLSAAESNLSKSLRLSFVCRPDIGGLSGG